MNKYCGNCGNRVNENDIFCINCGVELKKDNSINNVNSVDKGGFGWGVLGFFVPLAGLILYLVWKKEKPKTAKSAGIGALIYAILYGILLIVVFSLAFLGGFNSATDDYYDYYDYDDYYDFE